MIASPLKTIIINDNKEAINAIIELVSEYEVVLVVIGLPIGLKGNETAQTKHVMKFAEELKNNGIEVALQDERLSSVSAKKSYRNEGSKVRGNKGLIDQTAAAILLQQYIDTYYS